MRTTSAETILKGVMALWYGSRELPGVTEFPVVRGALDLTLKEGWEQEWWPDLMRREERYFRANWLAASTYNKGDEVYDTATQDYFQCLRDGVTGAGQSPTDSAGDERSAYWARSETSYSGAEWSADSVSYAVGDIKYYPVTNRYYQCHTAHTSSGVLVPDATGGSDRWGLLTPFERRIDFDATGQTAIGDVLDVKDKDVRLTKLWKGLEWTPAESQVWVVDDVVRCWVEFRILCPRIFGDTFDDEETYAAGDQVYWDNDGAIVGNFYNCLASTTAGEDPTDTPAKWELVELPKFLEGFAIYASYGKCLTGDDREDKQAAALTQAAGYLELEADKVYRQQGQSPLISVRTY